MKKVQQGFTLIELMIVIAIIGILAAIALPAYQQYTNKARFSEVVLATAGVKTAVEVCGQTNGSLAGCNTTSDGGVIAAVNGAAGGPNVASVTAVANGAQTRITATGNAPVASTYILDGTLTANGAVTWALLPTSTCVNAGLCN